MPHSSSQYRSNGLSSDPFLDATTARIQLDLLDSIDEHGKKGKTATLRGRTSTVSGTAKTYMPISPFEQCIITRIPLVEEVQQV